MDKNKKQTKNQPSPTNGIKNPPSQNDPMGSYTGVPLDEGEIPTQDADDLWKSPWDTEHFANKNRGLLHGFYLFLGKFSAYFLRRFGNGVLDGVPFYLFEKRDNGNGSVGNHKHRESEKIYYLMKIPAVYVIPLGYNGERTQHKKHCIEA